MKPQRRSRLATTRIRAVAGGQPRRQQALQPAARAAAAKARRRRPPTAPLCCHAPDPAGGAPTELHAVSGQIRPPPRPSRRVPQPGAAAPASSTHLPSGRITKPRRLPSPHRAGPDRPKKPGPPPHGARAAAADRPRPHTTRSGREGPGSAAPAGGEELQPAGAELAMTTRWRRTSQPRAARAPGEEAPPPPRPHGLCPAAHPGGGEGERQRRERLPVVAWVAARVARAERRGGLFFSPRHT